MELERDVLFDRRENTSTRFDRGLYAGRVRLQEGSTRTQWVYPAISVDSINTYYDEYLALSGAEEEN